MKAVNDTVITIVIIFIIIISIISFIIIMLSLPQTIRRGRKSSGTQGRMYRTVLVDNNNRMCMASWVSSLCKVL